MTLSFSFSQPLVFTLRRTGSVLFIQSPTDLSILFILSPIDLSILFILSAIDLSILFIQSPTDLLPMTLSFSFSHPLIFSP